MVLVDFGIFLRKIDSENYARVFYLSNAQANTINFLIG